MKPSRKFSIARLVQKHKERINEKHSKKLDKLLVEKSIREGIHKNPNETITNLSNVTLSEEEIEVLEFGLKHGIATTPSESEMFVVVEDMFAQISKLKSYKYPASEERIKTALKSFTFQYLDIDEKQTWQDKKRIKVIRRLHERVVILKPDKGQGVVLINRTDYVKSMESLFGDKKKFKVVDRDPTITRVNTIQTYLNNIFKRNEITEEEKNGMRPKGGNRARARGLPKIHKEYDSIPKFRPIIDTIGTPYHGIGTFLKNLLNPLTQNEFTVKDSFEAVNKIHNIPSY